MMTDDAMARLVSAVRKDDVASAAALLDAHPELRERINESPQSLSFGSKLLHVAVNGGRRAMAALLIDAGADVNATSDWWAGGFGMLESADPSLVPFLLERGARMTAHSAARLGLRDELERLLDADPSLVHARAGDGKTPLHYAAAVDVARLLVSRGAELDARDVDHESTPAQWLIADHREVARWLVEQGAHEDILMAAALGNLGSVRRILDQNPSAIDVTVSPRSFPMRDSRAGGSIYIWTLGANASPHQIAHRNGHHAVFDLLMDRTPVAGRLAAACDVGDEALCEALLAANPDRASSIDAPFRAKIVAAAERGSTTSVRLFLRAGWPVDTVNARGATALHWAAYQGNLEMVHELLRHGARLDITERQFGGTPYAWAEHASRTCGGEHARRAGEAARLLAPSGETRVP